MDKSELLELVSSHEEEEFTNDQVEEIRTSLLDLEVEDSLAILREFADSTDSEVGQKPSTVSLMKQLATDDELYARVSNYVREEEEETTEEKEEEEEEEEEEEVEKDE